MEKTIKDAFKGNISLNESILADQAGNIAKAAEAIIGAIRGGGKLVIFGNGGSAADSQHIAAELVGRFKKERAALAAIALTTDTSILTAVANDYGYDKVFARQIEALGKPGDAALALSTSGNSKNAVEAVRKARALGMKTIGLVGSGGGALKKECDIAIVADSGDTPRVQESHILIGHILCELVENGCQ